MKGFIYLFTFITLSLSVLHVNAMEVEHETELIEKYTKDVTGDGNPETIKLYGEPFSPDGAYYRDIYVLITSNTDEWRINYQGGYNPALEFYDLNHDGINNLFFQSAAEDSGKLYYSQLDSLSKGNLKNISLPDLQYVKGYFLDEFNVAIEIAPNKQPIVLDVEEKKFDYIGSDIYDEKGKILKETNLIIGPISFYEPAFISKGKGYGLKSYKSISGLSHADELGLLETLWYFENDKWIVLNTKWIASK